MDHPQRYPLFTIGHSNMELPLFLKVLRQPYLVNHTEMQIQVVCDVRSAPYSRKLPHFNRPELEQHLKKQGFLYVYLGKELGGRSPHTEHQSTTKDGRIIVDYRKVAQSEIFQKGMERLLKGVEQYCVVLLCAEQDPLQCHRMLLVCRHLPRDLQIFHIVPSKILDKQKSSTADMPPFILESQQDAERRLLKTLKNLHPQQKSLFDEPNVLEEAYTKQMEKISYRIREE